MDEAYKDIPVITWNNVDTVGYIALCSTTNASFSVDNFSIENLDSKAMPATKTAAALTNATAKTKADKDAKLGDTVSVNLSDMFTLTGENTHQVTYTANIGTIAGGVWTYTPTEIIIDDVTVTAHFYGKTAEYKFAVSTTKAERELRSCNGTTKGFGSDGIGLMTLIVLAASAIIISIKSKKQQAK